jgi:hypothetical protein
MHKKKDRTSRPKAWNILSEVPSGLLKKYLASSISSSLLYRIFLSGGIGKRFIPLRPIELMFVTAPEFHPRGS